MPRNISATLDRDAAWIMTLWRVLHQENAAPGDIAADVIANLSQFVPTSEQSFGIQPFPSPACAIVFDATDPYESGDAHNTDTESDHEELAQQCDLQCYDPDDFSIHHYYFNFKGVFYCLDRPTSACLPTAA
jgi:hypothetical protein